MSNYDATALYRLELTASASAAAAAAAEPSPSHAHSSPHAHPAASESSAHAEPLIAPPARDLHAQPAAVHVVPIPETNKQKVRAARRGRWGGGADVLTLRCFASPPNMKRALLVYSLVCACRIVSCVAIQYRSQVTKCGSAVMFGEWPTRKLVACVFYLHFGRLFYGSTAV